MREFFPGLIGNSDTKSRLSRYVLRDTVPHALMLVGQSGSGKKTLVKELAAALNCENKHSGAHTLPCHSCNTCRRIESGIFADIHFSRRDPKKMSLGVDEIHKIEEDIFLSSTESDYRIYVIEEANKMTPQAQNAILKTLEEPPNGVIIILLAEETDKILTTVKSRVQTVNMQKFNTDELKAAVIRLSERALSMARVEPKKLSGILITSDGRIGRALALTEDGRAAEAIAEGRKNTLSFISALEQNTAYSTLYSRVKELPTSRAEFTSALEEILLAMRDLMLLYYDKDAPLTYFASKDEALSYQINTKRLFSVYEIITDTLEDNAKNANISAQIANLAAKIRLI